MRISFNQWGQPPTFEWFQWISSPPQVIFLLVMLDPNNLGEATGPCRGQDMSPSTQVGWRSRWEAYFLVMRISLMVRCWRTGEQHQPESRLLGWFANFAACHGSDLNLSSWQGDLGKGVGLWGVLQGPPRLSVHVPRHLQEPVSWA